MLANLSRTGFISLTPRFICNNANINSLRFVSSSSGGIKVVLIGAAGGIGQPLGLLLKKNAGISQLALYDLVGVKGVAADLSHIDTPAKVTGHLGGEELVEALNGANIVVVPAGVPRKPGMTRDDLFNTNAGIVRDIAEAAAKCCPKAFFCVITNPVNSTVPVAAEVFKNNDCFDPKRLMGVTLLDVVRAQAFVAELKGLDVQKTVVPVIGGHSGVTIVPLLSRVQPSAKFSDEELKALSVRIQEAGTEVVKAKAGAGSATLSMAVAAERFVELLIQALQGKRGVQACAYVASNVYPGVDYFAGPVELGPNGVEKVLPFDQSSLTSYERELVAKAIPDLKSEIAKGVKFIREGI